MFFCLNLVWNWELDMKRKIKIGFQTLVTFYLHCLQTPHWSAFIELLKWFLFRKNCGFRLQFCDWQKPHIKRCLSTKKRRMDRAHAHVQSVCASMTIFFKIFSRSTGSFISLKIFTGKPFYSPIGKTLWVVRV